MEVYNLYVKGSHKEAEAAQLELSKAEWGFAKGGINGTKWVVAKMHGYPEQSCHGRRPYPKFSDKKTQDWILKTVGALEESEKSIVLTAKR